MRVGILTQYYRKNYGGVLQSYALYHVLQNLGHEVEMVDFRYNAAKNQSFWQRTDRLLKKLVQRKKTSTKVDISTRALPKEHVAAFNSFKQQYLKYSPQLTNQSIGQYVSKYDALIVGSDQVWNDLTGKHLFYFFDFGSSYNGKKITYAPCSVVTEIPPFNKKKLNKLLNQMDSISARDENTYKLVESISGIQPEIVLDPTLLYDFSEFCTPAVIKGDYIFAYILGSEIEHGHNNVLNSIFAKYGRMKVVAAIIPNISLEVEKFADEVRYNASPDEWVNLIANARFVYTDSFHGCVFSMKFHKPFFAYYKDAKRTSRLIDLKNTYQLDNIRASEEEVCLIEPNYAHVDVIIDEQKSKSLGFLKMSLQN